MPRLSVCALIDKWPETINYKPAAFAILACAFLFATKLVDRRIFPALTDLGAASEGVFPRDGHYPGEPFQSGQGVRLWGSWGGADSHTGALTLGPFASPATLHVGLSGYPLRTGNALIAQRSDTLETFPLRVLYDVGERWQIADFKLPENWVGQSITLRVSDNTTTTTGWFGISEPVQGISGNVRLFDTLAAWAANGVLLGLPWFAAMQWLRRQTGIASPWLPLAAAGIVALCGYAAFWAYFMNAFFGKIFSAAVLLVGLCVCSRRRPLSQTDLSRDATAPSKLLVAIGIFYVGLLHLFPSSLDIHSLAAHRFGSLPGDNTLPHNTASSLFRGEPLKSHGSDWLSSDRPPLQAGWLLLARPLTAFLAHDASTIDGTAAIWFQLLWVLAAFALLRTLGVGRGSATAATALLAFSGFFALNTLFTWPKLSAAAFACGAFAFWILRDGASQSRGEVVLGALFAALAWLSHGGVAFSFLVLVPWIASRALRSGWLRWLLAVAVFGILAAPWSTFQKFYDPPGNRLLKWHLAGQIAKDDRSTWPTIRDAYRASSWREITAHRQANLKFQVEGNWRAWRYFSPAGAVERRNDEFVHTARALVWWIVGLGALPIALLRNRGSVRWSAHAALAVWSLGAIALWCALMFIERSAVIHQGSYATMLTLFVLLSAWSALASRWMLALIGGLQLASFGTTWMAATPALAGPVNLLAITCLGAAVATMAVLVATEWSAVPLEKAESRS
jgi:hypothetical protein